MFTRILHRPALAIVISIMLLFLGVLGIETLPKSQFPDVAPPMVQVAIAYPGASANVLVDAVLIPLEQSINGVQNMRYIASSATSAGEAVIRIFFEPGTDPNINVVNVQNRVNIMLNRLPPLVVREGILVSQVVPSMLMYVNIYSTDPNADQKFLYNFANVNVMPVLKRIQGMGNPRNPLPFQFGRRRHIPHTVTAPAHNGSRQSRISAHGRSRRRAPTAHSGCPCGVATSCCSVEGMGAWRGAAANAA